MIRDSAAQPLQGRTIVITRPREQSQALATAVRERGGTAIVFPMLEILGPSEPRRLHELVARLETFDVATFVSPIAVDRALDAIEAKRTMPPKLELAAVGAATARALERRGYACAIKPDKGSDSEALLAQRALQHVSGLRIIIFRGEGGRELLAQTLTARGAIVEYAECYRRAAPATDPTPLVKAWNDNSLDAVIVTTAEALRNLHAMLGPLERARLLETPIFVPHARIAEAARALGLQRIVTSAAGDEALVAALVKFFAA